MSATDTPDTGAVPPRLVTTAGAADLLRRLSGTHGELMMHQSGGCCGRLGPDVLSLRRIHRRGP